MKKQSNPWGVYRRSGLSLMEVLAVVTLMGIIAMIAVPRLATSGDKPKANSCFATKGMIEVQAELWLRNKGVPPAASLNDIMADNKYFPDGAVVCPVDGSAYRLNTTNMTVNGHTHTDLLD
ncbi:MAG: prepilin-type N-terminal cleavage/methylation domain-containing protein [Planctomycetaceae bacterium]|nr:prepilin-type N-terminal cleavage/methylation domain-containing protein [Planctomycetales bacterium]MCB9926057.1 prepilin-type N-terminal cleavage/methylation domain-containing protein [Planctomycetaceae bacterium]